jgi:hypothetical protein
VPFPDPLAPAVTVIQLALLVAVQAQPVPPVTLTLPVAAAATTEALVAPSVYVQAPACVMVNVCPPIVIVPVCDEVFVLAVIEYPTDPFPEPLAPLVTVIQLLLLAAVHVQPAVLVTDTDPVVAAELTDTLVGDSV